MIKQKSSTASDFEFPCKPLLGPFPELMQPQSGLKDCSGKHCVASAHKRGMLEV